MTTDELILKLLDGTITTGENDRLQAMMQASPELAEEVRQLRAVEDLLADQTAAAPGDATPFLRSVENRIAGSLTAQTGQAVGIPYTVLAPLLVLIGSIGVFFVVQPSSDEPVRTPASGYTEQPVSLEVQVPREQPVESTPRSLTRSAAAAARPHTAPTGTTEAARSPESVSSNARQQSTVEGNASISTVPSYTQTLIANNRTEFDALMRDGKTVQAVIVAERLGQLYTKTGNAKEALAFLTTTLTLSRQVGLREYEARALGGLGLLAARQGNRAEAETYLRDCVSLLEQAGNPTLLASWREELAKLSR